MEIQALVIFVEIQILLYVIKKYFKKNYTNSWI